jgi:hypothetical protein
MIFACVLSMMMKTRPLRSFSLGISLSLILLAAGPALVIAKGPTGSTPHSSGSAGAKGTEPVGVPGDSAGDEEVVEVPTVMPNAAAPATSDLILSPVGKGDAGQVVPIAFKPLTAEEFGVAETDTYTFSKTVTEDGVSRTLTYTQTVKEILTQLNQIEEGLNTIGYSLRDEQEDDGPTILRLSSQSKETADDSSDTSEDDSTDTGGTYVTATARSIGLDHDMDKWRFSQGDKDILKFETWVDMSSSGHDGEVELSTDSETSLWLLGHEKELAEFHSDATLDLNDRDHDQTGRYRLEIFGDEKIDAEHTAGFAADNGKEMQDSVSKQVKISKSLRFWVGPIPVKVSLSLKGTPKFSYYQDFQSNGIQVNTNPSLKINLDGSASVNLVVVEAGVSVNVTALNAELNFDARIHRSFTDSSNRIYASEFSGTADWTVLKGSVTVWAEVNNPFGKDNRYKIEILDWNGIKDSGVLFGPYSESGGYE